MQNQNLNNIIECLQTVYDPEFPMVDLYTLGLIYDVKLNWDTVNITMTYTTIACPLWDMLQQLVKNAILERYPKYEVNIEITFDPMRNPSMIKDTDIQKLFNN
jgi:metal-sulfur cluster biosynthetic enzyme